MTIKVFVPDDLNTPRLVGKTGDIGYPAFEDLSPEQKAIYMYMKRLSTLIEEAENDDVVLTIDLRSTKPLRMGGYEMVPRARIARKRQD